MWWIAAAGLVKGAYNTVSGKKGIKAAGDASSKYILQETKEQVRRERISLGQLLGEGHAAVSASGLRQSGSPKNYLDFLETEGNKKINWLERSGRLRARAARKGANIQASNFQNQGIQTMVGQGIQTYNLYQRSNPDSGYSSSASPSQYQGVQA